MSSRTDRNRPLYMISVAAELAGVHPQTLRLELINELTGEGINLAGVIRILDLQGRLDERDQELDDLHKRVRRLADRVHELETRESVNALVRVADMPSSLRRLP